MPRDKPLNINSADWGWLWHVGLFSMLINLLHLTGPLFMLQVYDRVLASANVSTLVGLFGITVLLYAFFGVLDFIRAQVMTANGERVTERMAEKAYLVSVLSACDVQQEAERASALDDVSTLRGFLISPVFTAIFDLPWAPIFLIFVFALHPVLGVVAIVAVILLAMLALANERMSRDGVQESAGHAAVARRTASTARRNADALRGNGMIAAMGDQWRASDQSSRETGVRAGAVNSSFAVTTKTLRMIFQSLVLGVGAYLAILGELSPGSMIAGTIVFGRTLAPLEQILTGYRNVVRARGSWANIKTWWYEPDVDEEKEILPAPKKYLEAVDVGVCIPGTEDLMVRNVNFKVDAGEVIGVLGPSGSGKSTMARALAGAWPVVTGKVCLDGADLKQWPREALGNHIGYLPQDIELFPGSVAKNIARFEPDADFDRVLAASELAGTHEMILNLSDGYNTELGENGVGLSAGQRQRVALARALYGDPFLVVLDEPNSNLDAEGDASLAKALNQLRERNRVVIVVAHRTNVLACVDKLMLMQEGRVTHYGERDKVLKVMQDAYKQVLKTGTA